MIDDNVDSNKRACACKDYIFCVIHLYYKYFARNVSICIKTIRNTHLGKFLPGKLLCNTISNFIECCDVSIIFILKFRMGAVRER